MSTLKDGCYSIIAATGLLACGWLTSVVTASSSKVTFTDECHCTGCHGVDRWSAKTDPEMPPNPNDAQPQPITYTSPSSMFKWRPPNEPIDESSQRVHEEQDWYSVKGEVVDVKVEQDGDVHIRLKDVGGDEKDGVVGCEIPLPDQPNEPDADDVWCGFRINVFAWTDQQFPFSFESDKTMKLLENPSVVVITGKAFYDIDHAPKNQSSNVRPGTANYSVWEIHPVMSINVVK